MPAVSDTLWRSPNLIPVTGQRYTLGWQDAKKDGPCFLVARIGVTGGEKVLDRFPLTESGWVRAWSALVELDASAARAVGKVLQERRASHAALAAEAERQAQVDELEARAIGSLRGVAYLGGYLPETAITPGWLYDVLLLEDRLAVIAHRQAKVLVEVPYSQIEDMEIGGPGLVKTGGRFVGGGFGAAGAVEGMAIAAVLNTLTTRISIKTVVRIQGTGCELFLLNTKLTPEQLRIAISRPLGAIRSARATQATRGTQHAAAIAAPSPVQELTKLADMLEKGLLTREEFDLMKAKLLWPPTNPKFPPVICVLGRLPGLLGWPGLGC
jgi:hypothetical protein